MSDAPYTVGITATRHGKYKGPWDGGWKLHWFRPKAEVGETWNGNRLVEADFSRALCGIRPRYGWAMDLFIEDECERCLKVAAKHGIELPEAS